MKDINPKYIVAAVIIVAVLLLGGQYAFAVDDCSEECRSAHEDDYSACLSECKANKQASVIDRLNETQVAWGDYCGNGCKDVDVWDYPACKSYCNSSNRAGLDSDTMTAFETSRPESIDISIDAEDASPMCYADAFACFILAADKKETQHAYFEAK